VTPHWVPEQSGSHAGLLDESRRPVTRAQFDAILVPTYREASQLDYCIDLALRTRIPLIVVCSKEVTGREVKEVTTRAGIEAFSSDLPSANPLGITFGTSSDSELIAASPGWTRDLSMKRNLGLILARLLGWSRLMYLDDDIRGIAEDDVDALAAALDDHSVSALIPKEFPDNSVACHAHRLGGGMQDVFASASGIGVRCDRDDLGFFPNIYNEDWFFFSDEAASHKIAKVGESHQLAYDPYEHPQRAAQEEFGDLLAEGLYARLDINEGISGVDIEYWRTFIERRTAFHERVAENLGQHEDRELAARARNSVRAARDQLDQITPSLCQKFVELWQSDLAEWRSYLTKLPRVDSIEDAFEYLGLDVATSPPSRR
jgi:glycosyltransferase involved in cell wall biosynthesis